MAVYGQHGGTLRGTITDLYGNPLDNVLVTSGANGTSDITSADGKFRLSLPSGRPTEVYVQHPSYKDTILTVTLKARQDTALEVALTPEGSLLDGVQITDHYNDSYTRIDPKTSFTMPTPNGGVESLIKSMPGTSSTNELSNQYSVRGGNYDENLVFVNDIQIYRPFLIRSAQQEGLSFVNLDLTQSVKFSAGGFEAKYGDKMSSVLDVEYKHPTTYSGGFSASLLGGSVYAGGKVKDAFTFLIGVRYKTNSYILKSMETKGTYKPNFFDTQFFLTWKLAPKWSLELLGNLARNKYKFIPEDRTTRYGTLEQSQQITIYYDGQEVDQYENYLGGLTLKFQPNERDLYKLILSSYYAKETETYDLQSQYWLSDIQADMGSDDNNIVQETSIRGYGTFLEHARNRLTAMVTAADLRGIHSFPSNKVEWSIKAQNEIIRDYIKEWKLTDSSGYVIPQPATVPGVEVPYDDPSRILDFGNYFSTVNQLNTLRMSGFVQSSWMIDEKQQFMLVSGLRAHFWSFNREFNVSPRFILSYTPDWKQQWVFRLKAGSYYQPPFYREMRRPDGTLNEHIKSQHSYQVALSGDYDLRIWNRPFHLSMEAYYKYMTDLISYKIDNVQIIYSGENDAKGYATGFDIKLSGEFIRGIESWISLSLMKTAEDLLHDYYYDADGNYVEPGYIRRPTDQRFAINVFFQDHVPFFTPLRVHLNLVFASGLPFGAPNAQRYQQTLTTPWYRRVDVGFSYMFLEETRDRMKHKSGFLRAIKNAGLFLEVYNILGINNVSSYMWIKDINNIMSAVPNYLSPRLINLKLAVEF